MPKQKKICKALSLILIFAMMLSVFSSAISVSALSESIDSAGGNGQSKVTTTIAPAKFKVTVPYVLPIAIDKDQNVLTADNAKIINHGNGPVVVKKATLTSDNDWELVSRDIDFKSVPVNSKQYKMTIQTQPVPENGLIDKYLFDSINGKSELKINYDADAAVQGNPITAQGIANIVFVIDWDRVPVATASNVNLSSFVSELNSFQPAPASVTYKARKSVNLDASGANAKVVPSSAENITKIDDNNTDYSIYAYVDDDNNGYYYTDAEIIYLPEDCSNLFKNSKLTSINLTGYNTSKVTDMSYMFSGCSNLTSLDVSNFDTRNVTDMSNMFSRCQNLTYLDVSNFNTSNATSMSNMFYYCKNLASLDVSNFDTSNATSMNCMFNYCENLTSLDVSNFDTSNVIYIGLMFFNCSKLTSLDVSKFDTSNVTNMINMFSNCLKLTSLDVSKFDTSNVTNMSSMFSGCSYLESLDVTNFDTSKATDMRSMFSGCSDLTSLDVSNFDTSKVINMDLMFYDCKKITSLDVSKFDTSNVTNMTSMFYNCRNLTSLDLSNFDTSNVKSMSNMFFTCSKLSKIEVSSFDVSNISSSSSYRMFYNCSKLVGGNRTKFNSSYIDKTYARIDNPPDEPGYFTYKAAA